MVSGFWMASSSVCPLAWTGQLPPAFSSTSYASCSSSPHWDLNSALSSNGYVYTSRVIFSSSPLGFFSRSLFSSSRKAAFPSSQRPWRAAWRSSGRNRTSVCWSPQRHPSLQKPRSALWRSSKSSSTSRTAPTSRNQARSETVRKTWQWCMREYFKATGKTFL